MYAITFDLTISALEKHYGVPYNNAYQEVRKVLKQYNFEWTQGSVYLSKTATLVELFNAINALKAITWFPHSVREIQVFKVVKFK